MAKQGFMIGMLSKFIRRNPRTSAALAFNLGVYAALATKRGLAKSDMKHLPGKLIELVPSMKDISSYVPDLPGLTTRRVKAPARAAKGARKPARSKKAKRPTSRKKKR